jgi:hypothetical protein
MSIYCCYYKILKILLKYNNNRTTTTNFYYSFNIIKLYKNETKFMRIKPKSKEFIFIINNYFHIKKKKVILQVV